MNGTRITDKDRLALVEDMVGIGDGKVGRVAIDTLGTQLVAGGPVAAEFSQVRSEITSGLVFAATWNDLSALTATVDGAGAEVPDTDSGTHPAASATGYDGAAVENAGRYSWNNGWGRWVRIGGTGLAAKANTADLAQVAMSGAYGDLSDRPTLGTAAATAATDYATAAQGGKADTALQPADVGTAAAEDVEAFATAAQGTKADSAVQPADLAVVATSGAYADLTGKPALGTAAATAATDYATAAQGGKADSAIQPGNAALSNAREWTGETVSQAEAEAGTATDRRAWSAVRVKQAIAAWWLASSAKAALDAVIAGVAANTSALAVLDARVDHIAISDVTRPGDAPEQFSSALSGEPEARPAISQGATSLDDDLGKVWGLPGAGIIAPRRAYALENNRVYRLRVAYKRLVDSNDPSGDAVQLKLRNLNKGKATVSTVVLASQANPVAADGVVMASIIVSKDAGVEGVEAVPPSTARYCTPYIETFGDTPTTGVGFFEWEDVTDIVLGGADVSDLRDDLSAEEQARIAADNAASAAQAAHGARSDNPHNVTKAQVGLGSADDTADAEKPVSGPQQAAFDAEATARENRDDALQQEIEAEATTRELGLQFLERNGEQLLAFTDASGNVAGYLGQDAILRVVQDRLRMPEGELLTTERNGAPEMILSDEDGNLIWRSGGSASLDELRAEATTRELGLQFLERNGEQLLAFTDASGNVAGYLGQDAILRVVQDRLRMPEGELLTTERNGAPEILLLDGDNNIHWRSGVPVVADVAATLPDPTIWGRELLRQTHLSLAKLADLTEGQIEIVVAGDSWTAGTVDSGAWFGRIAARLFDAYGDGGGGWCSWSYWGAYDGPYTHGGSQPTGLRGNMRPSLYPVSLDGAWQRALTGSPTPDGGYVESGTAGDSLRVSVPAEPDHTALRLCWLGTSNGVVRWRLDGGSWTTLNVQGGVGVPGHEDIPVTPGAHLLEIEVVSGTVRLSGVVAMSDAPGVRIHKMGASGSQTYQWNSPDEDRQRDAWQMLGPVRLWVNLDGTNSQGANRAVATWADDQRELVRRIRAAFDVPDVVLCVSAENQQDRAIPMTEYQRAALRIATDLCTAFINMQAAFGDPTNPGEYASDGPLPLMKVDGIHANDDGHWSMAALAYPVLTH
ncbi:hypothetical protein JYP51_09370 [Ponticoccus gilvus]|nr:hypothetical protein [Enemella evansiae]